MRTRFLIPILLALCVGAVALALPDRSWGAGVTEIGDGPGLAVSLRAARFTLQPGQSLVTSLELANLGARSVTATLGCDPAADLQVYDGAGRLVWRLHPDCVEEAHQVTLAGGAKETWAQTWPGTLSDGTPAPLGHYLLYGLIHLQPVAAVAGPVAVDVVSEEEPTRVPTDRPPERTATPRTPEPTATPAVSGTVFPVADAEGRQVRPDVAGYSEMHDCQSLVIWWDETARAIWGRFVGAGWRGEPFLISGEAGASGPAKVALNAGRKRWLVVWPATTQAGPSLIYGRYVDCGGLEGATFGVGRTDGPVLGDDQPAVSAAGNALALAVSAAGNALALAVWQIERADGGADILGRHVALAASQVTLVGTVAGGGPVVLGVAPLRVTVRRVLRGTFDCTEAQLFVDATGSPATTPQVGDLLSVRGEVAPAQGACALVIGPPGTYLLRSPRSQVTMPIALYR